MIGFITAKYSFFEFMQIIKTLGIYLIAYTITYYGIKYSMSDHVLITRLNMAISGLTALSFTVLFALVRLRDASQE